MNSIRSGTQEIVDFTRNLKEGTSCEDVPSSKQKLLKLKFYDDQGNVRCEHAVSRKTLSDASRAERRRDHREGNTDGGYGCGYLGTTEG